MLRVYLSVILLLVASTAFAADCQPTPYVIQMANNRVQVELTLPAKLAADSTKPDLRGAVEYAQTVYAAMGPSVVREILDAYSCRVYKAIDADATKTPEEKTNIRAAWNAALLQIKEESSLYFVAFKANIDAAANIRPTSKIALMSGTDWRSPATYLDAIPIENFDKVSSFDGYISGNFKGVTATACGQYVRAALAANAGQIQHLAGSVRPMLVKYFENTPNGPQNALVDLYGEAATVPLASAPGDAVAATNLRNCK